MIEIPGMLMVGARSKADGKTTFICRLIERFSSHADIVGVKISTVDSVTRAKDEVYLIVPQVYRNRSRSLVMMKPSRFLTEIEQNLTEKMELEEGLPHLIGGQQS